MKYLEGHYLAGANAPRAEKDRGRNSTTPGDIPILGLRDVIWRVVEQASRNRIALIAAGLSYYLLLALFPSLAALVSLYGFFADPSAIATYMGPLHSILPPGAFGMIEDQLAALALQNTSSLGIGFATGLAIALWSSRNGVLAFFDAMNVAYNEDEKRGFMRINLLAFAFAIGILIVLILILAALALLPAIFTFIMPDSWLEPFLMTLRWPLLAMLVGFATSCLYRYGPSREPARMRWLSWGAVLSTCAWLIASLAFSHYLQNFGDYSSTYGTLGAVAGFMVWSWLSAVIVILGAVLNGELEHQTARDTTTGEPRPMGARGAYVADSVGRPVD